MIKENHIKEKDGKVFIDTKKYDLAINYIKEGLKKSFRHYTWLERDTSWSYEPWDLLCLACFYGGYKKDSIAYALKALMFEPNNERLRGNLEACLKYTDNNEII